MITIISNPLVRKASILLRKHRAKARAARRPFKTAEETRITPPRIGLALSSGGAKGLAHIGVLQVLEENGIRVDAVSGSSMGSFIGAHLARGSSAEEMKELASRMVEPGHLRKIADPVIPPLNGFMKGENARNFLNDSIGNRSFSDLKLPLYVIAFDLDTQEKLVIHQGNVAHAVHASCAIPGVITPVNWNGRRCSDGGVVDPLPVLPLKQAEPDLDLIIAVSLLPSLDDISLGKNRKQPSDDPKRFPTKVINSVNQKTNVFAKGNTVDTLKRSVRAAQVQINHASCSQADIVISPEVYNLSWHSFSEIDHIIEAGRKAALEQLPALKEKVSAIQEGKGTTIS